MPNKHYIQIFIEEAKTPLSNGNKSKAGYMWFQLSKYDKNNKQVGKITNAGYTNKGIVNTDNEAYEGSPACESQRLEITQEAYNELMQFANTKDSYAQSLGFGIDDYNPLTNSCVDYVWKALEIAGYNKKRYESDLVLMFNCVDIRQIKANTKDTIINRNDLLYHLKDSLKQHPFYFDFSKNEQVSQAKPKYTNPHQIPLKWQIFKSSSKIMPL